MWALQQQSCRCPRRPPRCSRVADLANRDSAMQPSQWPIQGGGAGKYPKCKRAHERQIPGTTPPTESRRLLETTEKFCYYPPPQWIASAFGDHGKILLLPPPHPLNRVDLALHTKGASPLGKSWICDDWFANPRVCAVLSSARMTTQTTPNNASMYSWTG